LFVFVLIALCLVSEHRRRHVSHGCDIRVIIAIAIAATVPARTTTANANATAG
jgi:hypothetical protein